MELLDQPTRLNPSREFFVHWKFRNYYFGVRSNTKHCEVVIFPEYSRFHEWRWRAALNNLHGINDLLRYAAAAIDNGDLMNVWTSHAIGEYQNDNKFIENLHRYASPKKEYTCTINEMELQFVQQWAKAQLKLQLVA